MRVRREQRWHPERWRHLGRRTTWLRPLEQLGRCCWLGLRVDVQVHVALSCAATAHVFGVIRPFMQLVPVRHDAIVLFLGGPLLPIHFRTFRAEAHMCETL
jgi:hypothetical protein